MKKTKTLIAEVSATKLSRCIEKRAKLLQFFELAKHIQDSKGRNLKLIKDGESPIFDESVINEIYEKLDEETWMQRCGSVAQVAEMCGVKKMTLLAWIRRGEVRAYKIEDVPAFYVCIDDVIQFASTELVIATSRKMKRKSASK